MAFFYTVIADHITCHKRKVEAKQKTFHVPLLTYNTQASTLLFPCFQLIISLSLSLTYISLSLSLSLSWQLQLIDLLFD